MCFVGNKSLTLALRTRKLKRHYKYYYNFFAYNYQPIDSKKIRVLHQY